MVRYGMVCFTLFGLLSTLVIELRKVLFQVGHASSPLDPHPEQVHDPLDQIASQPRHHAFLLPVMIGRFSNPGPHLPTMRRLSAL
jgi:hypothetical protein